MIDLPEQTVLIVGVGGAGGEASKLCAALAMRGVGIDPAGDRTAARDERPGNPRAAGGAIGRSRFS